MSQMVKQVAKAIDKYLDEQEDNRYWAEGIARAAIDAMREPTERMLAEGARMTGDPLNVGDAYRTMIDTALGEDK